MTERKNPKIFHFTTEIQKLWDWSGYGMQTII